MTLTSNDLLSMRRWGRNAVQTPEHGSALLAGQYMAMAKDEERIVLRGEFEEGVRNSAKGMSQYNDAMWSLKDWQRYFEEKELW